MTTGLGALGPAMAPRPVVIKPKPPPPLTSVEKGRIENHNMKQLVAPKPPFRILNEMVGGGVRFEYTENPPLPTGVAEEVPLHTLLTEVEGDTPFELSSIAIFKMLNEWEASGFELPPAISDVLYSQQMFVPVKQRLEWIRGSNL